MDDWKRWGWQGSAVWRELAPDRDQREWVLRHPAQDGRGLEWPLAIRYLASCYTWPDERPASPADIAAMFSQRPDPRGPVAPEDVERQPRRSHVAPERAFSGDGWCVHLSDPRPDCCVPRPRRCYHCGTPENSYSWPECLSCQRGAIAARERNARAWLPKHLEQLRARTDRAPDPQPRIPTCGHCGLVLALRDGYCASCRQAIAARAAERLEPRFYARPRARDELGRVLDAATRGPKVRPE